MLCTLNTSKSEIKFNKFVFKYNQIDNFQAKLMYLWIRDSLCSCQALSSLEFILLTLYVKEVCSILRRTVGSHTENLVTQLRNLVPS
jgi:hypothetical protein